MILNEVIKQTSWEEVSKSLVQLYEIDNNELLKYKEVYDQLIEMLPDYDETFYITIRVEYDELNQPNFDVLGYDKENESTYSMNFISRSKWLGLIVDENELQQYGASEFITHCLWEMTFYSFDEQEVLKQQEEISEMLQMISQKKYVIIKKPCFMCNGTKKRSHSLTECTICDENGNVSFMQGEN